MRVVELLLFFAPWRATTLTSAVSLRRAACGELLVCGDTTDLRSPGGTLPSPPPPLACLDRPVRVERKSYMLERVEVLNLHNSGETHSGSCATRDGETGGHLSTPLAAHDYVAPLLPVRQLVLGGPSSGRRVTTCLNFNLWDIEMAGVRYLTL